MLYHFVPLGANGCCSELIPRTTPKDLNASLLQLLVGLFTKVKSLINSNVLVSMRRLWTDAGTSIRTVKHSNDTFITYFQASSSE